MTSVNHLVRQAAAFALLALASSAAFSSTPAESVSAVPPGYTLARTGSVHDFDYFMGSGWTTRQHRIKTAADGSQTTDDFTGYLCALPYLNGTATVDELYFPSKKSSGLTLRLFNPKTRQWSIYWVSSTNGVLDPNPVVGGFKGNLGLFFGTDRDAKGRPIKVRFIWKVIDHDHAQWQQAISYDNHTWATNWTADFERTERSKVCTPAGLPRHL
ncbi:MAG TPA: hypothetical protein VFM15_01360 [Gammaproteobacteria bacterium]|nr:hypothetical protein [Gammaproteobacteria bacterium]